MKKLVSSLIALLFLVSGCTFNVQVLNPGDSQPTPFAKQNGPTSTFTAVATISATAEPTATPTLVPTVTYPNFANARMGASPDDPNRPTSFPAGTKAVYAIWDYQNMRDGLMIKREWYWNGQPWLTREERWDFNKYGANGTIRDISIYDNETGLNTGRYQLRLYIDNVLQPIGSEINAPINPWINFQIGGDNSYTEYISPDSKLAAAVSGTNQLSVRDANGKSSVLYTGNSISYVAWLPDSQHIVFVDRFHVDPRLGAEGGIQDILQIVDVLSRETNILYESDAPLGIASNPVISPDGRYIAAIQGSGGGDACFMSLRSIFFELEDDFQSAKVIEQTQFSGLPNLGDSTVYPTQEGWWVSPTEFLIPLKITCTTDESSMGDYIFNLATQKAVKSSSSVSIPGDLGWGEIHGRVTDAITGQPIAGASVTCEHHSYTSTAPALCSGSVATDADGSYVFGRVFFHDTDKINLIAQVPGYRSLRFERTAFTTNDMEANMSLNPIP